MLHSSLGVASDFQDQNTYINRHIPVTSPGEKSIQILNPKSMSTVKIQELSDVLREMWSSENGLQELVYCSTCNSIFSKKDIFGHLEKNIYDLAVGKIMNVSHMKTISCPCCQNDTRFIYGNEHTQAVRKRLLDSIHSFLVVAENDGDIVGTGLWYIPRSFTEMYQLEFHDHYQKIGINTIRERVRMVLDTHDEKMIMFAAIGFLDKFRNLFQLIEFLRLAFSDIPDEYSHLPGIMELDKNNTMHSLFTSIGGISLGLGDGDSTNTIVNTQESYKSDIVVLPNAVQLFHDNFGAHVSKREILRKLHTNKTKAMNTIH